MNFLPLCLPIGGTCCQPYTWEYHGDRLELPGLIRLGIPMYVKKWRHVALFLLACLIAVLRVGGDARGADQAPVNAMLKQYCFACHAKATAMGGVNLEQLSAQTSIGDGF